MAAPVPLRTDFDAQVLRVLAMGSRDPAQPSRLLALSDTSEYRFRTGQCRDSLTLSTLGRLG
jgi:hypothetical protein